MASNSPRNKAACAEPSERVKNFGEVALGYTEDQARMEAERCLNCKHRPCTAGCPVSVKIPEFLAEVKNGDFKKAYEIIKETNALPAVCGRVCPQEIQCEGRCVRGIKGESVGIGALERFAADWYAANVGGVTAEVPAPNGHKVAVIGSGPAGLTCAGDLAKLGYKVVIFEALHEPGGVLIYGIPEFRLPKSIVSSEIENLKALGVEIQTNMVIGKILGINELFTEEGFDAVFVGSGAGLPSFMGIPGEGLKGVYSANEYLTRVNLMKAYLPGSKTPILRPRKVAVIGGGNVAMDAARCALRMGAEKVYIVYRRSEAELPARKEEVEHAREEGIEFRLLTAPVEILGDENGSVKALNCIEMELGAPDASGRRSPIPKPGSEFTLETDCVIVAIGTSPNPLIKNTTEGLLTDKRGVIIASDNGKTSLDGVYAGGDAVTGAATVILAMGAGKTAAQAIDEFIKEKEINKKL